VEAAQAVTFHAFLFDADNTLFDFDRAEEEAFTETLGTDGTHKSGGGAEREASAAGRLRLEFRRINGELWAALQAGTISPEFLRVERFRRLTDGFKLAQDPSQLAERYVGALSRKAYTMPGAVAVLDALSRRATLGLLTNGLATVQRARIARAELEVFFAGIFIGEEIGIQKPNPEAFHAALQGLHVSAQDTLYVGDDPSADVRGAHAAGIAACWYNPKSRIYPETEEKPDMAIATLEELLQFCPQPS
jgi:YjjG family noncanonical pyrimidine nucleotidase